jgi:protein TonB
MFSTLLESKAKTQRSIGGSFVSLVAHATIIGLAIQATLHAGQRTKVVNASVQFTEVKPDQPAPPKPAVMQVAPPKGFQTLTAPLNIPDVLPEIDLTRPPTNPLDWSGKGAPAGRDSGLIIAPPSGNHVYAESQVEKPVMPLPGSPAPRYPDILKAAGVEGEVAVSFVVDTLGRAEPGSITILNSTNELFGASVKSALPLMRFLPAETNGRKVRQLVQQPFKFTIIR